MSWLLAIGLKNALLALPLALVAMAVHRWCKRPALAHVLWALVLVKLLTPPLVDVPVGWKIDPAAWLMTAGAVEQAETATATTAAARETRSSVDPASRVTSRRSRALQSGKTHSSQAAIAPHAPSAPRSSGAAGDTAAATWLRVAGGIWLAGSVCMALVYVWRAWRFRRFVRFSIERDHILPARVGELAAEVGVGVPPHVLVVDGVVSPMLWGVGQSAQMIFPARLAKRLSPAELDSLLLHELAHYSRGDHFVRVLELASHVLYWWNPLVWFARRQIEAVEEECCDAWVVRRQQGTRHGYAEALLTTIDFLCERPVLAPPAACGLGEVQMLKLRLTQIMRGEPTAPLSPATKALVLGLGAAIAPLEPAVWATSTPPSRAAAPAVLSTANPGDVPSSTMAQQRSSSGAAGLMGASGASRVPASPAGQQRLLPPLRPPAIQWATAVARNGNTRLEARVGRKTTLVNPDADFRLDLSSHQITCASFAPDSVLFATGHDDAIVRLWDSQTGGMVRSLKGAEAAITSLHISPDGRFVAAGTAAGHVVVWQLDSGDEIARLPAVDKHAASIRWSRRGDRLAVALGGWSQGSDATLLVWSPVENVVLLEQSLAQPAGAIDWLGNDEALIVAGWNGQAQVWNPANQSPMTELALDKDQVSAAAWSPDCPLVNGWLAGQLLSKVP